MREIRSTASLECAQHAHGADADDEERCTAPDIAVLADDLSGAAEVAGTFLDRAIPLSLRLDTFRSLRHPASSIADLNTRTMTPHRGGADRARRTDRGPCRHMRVLKKIDSLLRGHIGAEVAVLAERGPVIVAAALPALGRTVRDGVLHVGDTPLHETDAWAAESASPPRAVADLFAGLAGSERITVCDADTDADLDAIVSAASRESPALNSSARPRWPPRRADIAAGQSAGGGEPQPSKSVLTVVGTAAPVATSQVDALVADGARAVTVDARALLHDKADPEPVQHALDSRLRCVTIGGVVEPVRGSMPFRLHSASSSPPPRRSTGPIWY